MIKRGLGINGQTTGYFTKKDLYDHISKAIEIIDTECLLLSFLGLKYCLHEIADFKRHFGSSQSLWQGI